MQWSAQPLQGEIWQYPRKLKCAPFQTSELQPCERIGRNPETRERIFLVEPVEGSLNNVAIRGKEYDTIIKNSGG